MHLATMLKGLELLATTSVVFSARLPIRDDRGHLCSPVGGQPWQPVDYKSVSRAIQAITSGEIGGNVGMGAGPDYCEVLVCVGDAAIALCNDNPFFITVPSARIAQMASGIQGVCYKFPPGGKAMTGGQLFDSGHFNVIVQKSECFVQRDTQELTAPLEAREEEVAVSVIASELTAPISSRDASGLLCIKDGTIAWNWGMVAINGPILDAIQALRNSNDGGLSMEAGPSYCEQVACADGAAIYTCNDNPHGIIINVQTLANLALEIYNGCWVMTNSGEKTGGQAFDTGGFNVIVNQNQCLPWVPKRVKREELMAPFEER